MRGLFAKSKINSFFRNLDRHLLSSSCTDLCSSSVVLKKTLVFLVNISVIHLRELFLTLQNHKTTMEGPNGVTFPN